MADVLTSEDCAPLSRLVDLNEMLYFGIGIKGDLDHSKKPVCPPLITFEQIGKF
jgi:hypothetical protein